MREDHNRRLFLQGIYLIGFVLCGYYSVRSPVHLSPRNEPRAQIPATTVPSIADNGLVVTLDGPSEMRIPGKGTRFMVTVRNASTAYEALSLYDYRPSLAFFDAAGTLVTDFKDCGADKLRSPCLLDLQFLFPGETIQLPMYPGNFVHPLSRGLYTVEAILRSTPENDFPPAVVNVLHRAHLHVWSSDCHSKTRIAIQLY